MLFHLRSARIPAMTSPQVSVVIPCFRQGRFLAGAIESVLAQTCSSIEVIVVNDGSDDDTEDVAARYGGRVRYVLKENGGLSSARNAGIAVARGRYLLFLDADDLIDRRAVMSLVEQMGDVDDRLVMMGFRLFVDHPAAEFSQDQSPAMAAEHFSRIFDIDPVLGHRPHDLNPNRLQSLPYLIYTNFGPPHCWLCSRRMVLNIGGFDETLDACEDWDLWLRLAMSGAQLVTLEYVGAFYRRYSGSMSTDNARMLDNRSALLLKLSRSLRDNENSSRLWGQDLLQAARRIRRRYIAFGIASQRANELSREIRFLQRFEPSFGRRMIGFTAELLGRASRDQIALALYRRFRPDLHSYYRADID